MLGMGGMDPAKMAGMMKKLGINQEEIDAESVIIEKRDGDKIVIDNPSVQKVTMQGQDSFQIAGDVSEESSGLSEDDVKLVVEKTGKNEEEVRKVLEEVNGEVAEAIVKLGE